MLSLPYMLSEIDLQFFICYLRKLLKKSFIGFSKNLRYITCNTENKHTSKMDLFIT